MSLLRPLSVLTLTASLIACGGDSIALACRPMDDAAGLAKRVSPYDSTLVTLGAQTAQVCYSRPAVNGRVVFGGIVPFDSLWRTGANEPTILHLPFDAEIAGLAVPAGHYSLYTVPSTTQWQLVINRSTSQWGITQDAPRPDGGVNKSAYTPEVAAQELGRTPIAADSTAELVERFTIRAEPGTGDAATLVLEWERTRVLIPIRATPAPK